MEENELAVELDGGATQADRNTPINNLGLPPRWQWQSREKNGGGMEENELAGATR
jgi:hypothetical protein